MKSASKSNATTNTSFLGSLKHSSSSKLLSPKYPPKIYITLPQNQPKLAKPSTPVRQSTHFDLKVLSPAGSLSKLQTYKSLADLAAKLPSLRPKKATSRNPPLNMGRRVFLTESEKNISLPATGRGTPTSKTKYLSDPLFQDFIIQDEMRFLRERVSQLRIIFCQGIKLFTKDVIDAMSGPARDSLNRKIVLLCRAMESISRNLSSVVQTNTEEESGRLMDFPENVKRLSATLEDFNKVFEERKIALRVVEAKPRKPLKLEQAKDLLRTLENGRLLANQIEEEYRLHEQSAETGHHLARPKPKYGAPKKVSLSKTANVSGVFARLAERSSVASVSSKDPPKEGMGEREKLGLFINGCLHKIFPYKDWLTKPHLAKILLSTQSCSPQTKGPCLRTRSKAKVQTKEKREKSLQQREYAQFLGASLEILSQTRVQEKEGVSLSAFIREIGSDYERIRAKRAHKQK